MSVPIIPKNAAARCDWFTNWNLEFPMHAAALGFTVAEISAIGNEAAWAIYACACAADAQSYGSAWVTWRNQLLEEDSTDPVGPQPMTVLPSMPADPPPLRGILHRFAGQIRRVKAAPAYTAAIGDQLRINPAPLPPPDPATAQPALEAAAEAMFKVRVAWTRQGFAALELQSQRGAETDWTSQGVKTTTEAVDARAPLVAGQPEVRRYRAIYVEDDAPVGLWSAVVSATTTP